MQNPAAAAAAAGPSIYLEQHLSFRLPYCGLAIITQTQKIISA